MTRYFDIGSGNPLRQARHYLRRLTRRQGSLMLGIALFVWAWMLVYALLYHKPQYTSEAMVIIRDSALTTRYVLSEQYYAVPTTSSSAANPVLNTMGLIESAAISDALWESLKANHPDELKRLDIKSRRDWEAYFGNGENFIKTKNHPGTDLITVKFTWTQPALAQEGLSTVLSAFQDASLKLNQAENANKSEYLTAQEADIRKRLEAIRAEKSAFKRKMDTVSVKREADELAATRILLGNTLADVQAKAGGKTAEVRRYEQMLGMSPSDALRAGALGQNTTMARLHDELYRLTQQEAMMKSSLTETNPKVLEVSAQIEQLKRNIANEATRTLGNGAGESGRYVSIADSTRSAMVDRMVSAQADTMRLNAEAGVLRQRLGQINASIRKAPGVEESLANLEQQENSLSAALDTLRQKLLEARMKENQTMGNVFIVDAPKLPQHEKFPTTNHLLLAGLMLGAFGGLGGGILKERMESRYRNSLLEWRPLTPQPGPVPVAQVSVKMGVGRPRVSYPVPEARQCSAETRIRHRELQPESPRAGRKRYGSLGATS